MAPLRRWLKSSSSFICRRRRRRRLCSPAQATKTQSFTNTQTQIFRENLHFDLCDCVRRPMAMPMVYLGGDVLRALVIVVFVYALASAPSTHAIEPHTHNKQSERKNSQTHRYAIDAAAAAVYSLRVAKNEALARSLALRTCKQNSILLTPLLCSMARRLWQ